MANSCNCGCYGALSCVPGPLQCGYQPAEPAAYQNYPFYNGPCPPGPHRPPCHSCGHCPPWWWDDCYRPVPEEAGAACRTPLAEFTASGPIHVEGGCGIPLTPSVLNHDLFSVHDGSIVLHKSGTYLATYTVNLPPQQPVNTQLSLRLDGNEVAGSTHSLIALPNAAASVCVSAQAVVQTRPNRILSLHSDNPCSINCENPNLITLTLIRIS